MLAVLQAPHEEKGGIHSIGASLETKIGDLARIILEVTGHKPELDLKPAPIGSVPRRMPNIAKITKLGFAPKIGLSEGVRTCWRG